ncbi:MULTISPECIES: acyl-CoA reductase [Ramlibacter]|uniref:Long-chain-fatty-acyl-CoA reductase n=1 Tax=Ramlibacter pinisoli TaxID=2682844 RepID=A0A6N8J3M6_9BURK|nr:MULTISPECIES: acyl-CoA reductase [Ramlibacter]MBA2962920.1 hypothetical protein [Ramlibacter sp. CGMCC 1.13660]MVQ32863.1 hypothetical protein [Ramlibacter pinisoli]
MFDELLWFEHADTCSAVRNISDPRHLIEGWQQLRSRMVRKREPSFTRDEWAYLLQFLAPERLQGVWDHAFGTRSDAPRAPGWLLVPPREVALWLPNNVSLLGCLTMVLVSLTGARLRIKAGSHSSNLCTPFASWASGTLPDGPLRTWLHDALLVQAFGRDDPANVVMSSTADARLFFGSDTGARAVENLPHAVDSRWFAFGTRVSEAWFTPAATRDAETVARLARVFAVYGQAGCTSPKRVVVIDGTPEDVQALHRLLAEAVATSRWPEPPQAQASEVVLGEQWARSWGLEAHRLPGQRALLVLSPAAAPQVFAHRALQLQWGTLEQAVATAPGELQTIGWAGEPPASWVAAIGATRANRFVPLDRMHDFGPVWDGMAWWRGLFREVERG